MKNKTNCEKILKQNGSFYLSDYTGNLLPNLKI
jgi:hypothetical protein